MPDALPPASPPTPGRLRVAAVLGPLGVFGLAAGVFAALPTPPDHRAGPVLETLAANPTHVVLGNSVAERSLDADALGWTSAVIPGGLPAHWVAAMDQADHAERFLLYAGHPSHDDVLLESPDDVALLVALSDGPDADLSRAVPGGGLALANQRRAGVRDGLVDAVANGPAELLFGLATPEPVVRPAMDRLFAHQGPNERDGPTLPHTPGMVVTGDALPTTASLDESLMPLLVERARAQGATLTVVLVPSRAAPDCQDPSLAPLRSWWMDQDVVLIDASAWSLPPGSFDADFHASPSGRDQITARLRDALAQGGDVLPCGL
jgi:hypothetical protein